MEAFIPTKNEEFICDSLDKKFHNYIRIAARVIKRDAINNEKHLTTSKLIGTDSEDYDYFTDRPDSDVSSSSIPSLIKPKKIFKPFNSICNYDSRHIASFVRNHFEERVRLNNPQAFARMMPVARRNAALQLLNQEWLIRYRSFFGIRMVAEKRAPLHHASWDYPVDNPKYMLFQEFKKAYRQLEFETGCQGWNSFATKHGGKTDVNWQAFKKYASSVSPMTPSIPYPSRSLWLKYLRLPDTQVEMGFAKENIFSPADYSSVAAHVCVSFEHLPFPPPPVASPLIKAVWDEFIHHSYPRRLLRINVTPQLEPKFQSYVAHVCKSIAYDSNCRFFEAFRVTA